MAQSWGWRRNFLKIFSSEPPEPLSTHPRRTSAWVVPFQNCVHYRRPVSTSLCLYCSDLGTFWLKIEQFWPFEEISIFSKSGHLGYRTAVMDTILKGDHLRIISAKFGWNWLSSFRGEDFFIYLPCNFEVNLITHLGVIALFSSIYFV
jgi:hypothetical protein